MPIAPAVGAALIGGAASIYSSSQAKKASNKALEAQNTASQQQLAAQQAALDKIIGLNQNAINGGNLSLNQLLVELGVTPSASAAPRAPAAQLSYDATGNVIAAPQAAPVAAAKAAGGPAGTSPLEPAPQVAPMTAPSGQPDYAAYGAGNPDLQAEWQRIVQTGNADGFGNDPNAYYARHWQQFGQNEPNRSVTPFAAVTPQAQPDAPTAPAPAQTQEPDPNAPPDLTTAGRPQAAAATDFTDRAPDLNSFFSNFEADPGAAYRRSEALGGVNAASAARGKLRSGDAVKALATLSSDLASQEYNNWFNRQNTLYNNSRNAFQNDRADNRAVWQYGVQRGDQNFNTDRSYQTQQENTRIGNLFDVARLGQQAAGNVSGATTNNANMQTSIFGSQANNAADAAYNRAQANNYAANGVGQAAANLFANWGGVTAPQTKSPPITGNWARGTW